MIVLVSYIDKGDVLGWCNIQLRGKLTEDDIPNIIVEFAHTKVIGTLIQRKVKDIPEEDDDFHLLKFATMSFILELLCKSRMITQSSGDVLSDKFGDVAHDYQNSIPMFFFAQGSATQFLPLLPYETFRMYGFSFIDAYLKRAFYERTGNTFPAPKVIKDSTMGGYDWNGEGEFDTEEEDDENIIYDIGISDDEEDIEHWD